MSSQCTDVDRIVSAIWQARWGSRGPIKVETREELSFSDKQRIAEAVFSNAEAIGGGAAHDVVFNTIRVQAENIRGWPSWALWTPMDFWPINDGGER